MSFILNDDTKSRTQRFTLCVNYPKSRPKLLVLLNTDDLLREYFSGNV
jgi:hypothetical protein